MIGKIRTFFSLPNRHKWIFIKTAVLVPLLEISLRTIKFKRTLTLLKIFLDQDQSPPADEFEVVRLQTNYLYLYHQRFPKFGNCLARSLTLWFLLKRKGIETDLKFGMKKEDEKLLAHSWLEYKGEALVTKSETDAGYVPFNESIVTEFSK